MTAPVRIILLAAGASTRMQGADKLLQEIDGTPLLLRQLRRAVAASAEVVLVLPEGDRQRRAWVGDSPARVVSVGTRAMSASIVAGIAGCTAPAALILLADMPEITTAHLEALVALHRAHPDEIIRATSNDGRAGQPVLFPARHFAALAQLTGDTGARALIAAEGYRPCPLTGTAALIDLDTPADWAAWRATRGNQTLRPI